jgi:hypothetical protein
MQPLSEASRNTGIEVKTAKLSEGWYLVTKMQGKIIIQKYPIIPFEML